MSRFSGRTGKTSSGETIAQVMKEIRKLEKRNGDLDKAMGYIPPPPPPATPCMSKIPVMPSGVGVPAKMPDPLATLSRCKDCGAAVWTDMVAEHEEWHETMTQAIREQIEEEMKNARTDVEAFNDVMMNATNAFPVLGYCKHGFDLDHEFCKFGCRA